jgi:diacylglycerol kinase family enzyme/membrane-associated phospholipid phosphatase
MMARDPEPPAVSGRATTGWGGVQRQVRLLVPGPIRRADLAVFRALARTEVPVIGPLLPRLSHAANHSRLWLAIGALSALVGGRFGRRAAVRGVLAIGATSALTNLPAKLLTGRTRPDLAVVPEIRRLARVPASTSFPSGHSASAFAFATAASLEEPRLRVPLVTLATAVATSRVYTGVHYPGDAIVGSLMGVAIARATTRPWPLTPRQPATASSAVVDDAPAVGRDGEGLVLVRNLDAGRSFPFGPSDRLLRELPRTRVVDVAPDDGLVPALRRAADEARVLAVAGGDGSVSAAAAIAHETGVPLAIVPSGTLNHLAKDLGVEEVDATIRALRAGHAIRMDVGRIDGRVFVNAASIGTYPHAVAARERLERHIGKWPAALWGVVRTLRTGEPLEVDIDGQPRRVWLLFVGNCCYAEPGVPATRRVRLDDGTLDVRVLDAEAPWARARIAASLLLGRVEHCRAYERWSATELHVRSRQGPLRLAADGETWTGPDELVVSKHPRSLLVLQPSDDAGS